MSLSRFWTPVRARPAADELPETIEAGEPETGVLSLRQLMESLSPPHASFDPDSTTHFSPEQLRLRREQIETRQARPVLPTEEPAQPPVVPEPPSAILSNPASSQARRLAPITKVSLALLIPAVALLSFPRSALLRSSPKSANEAEAAPSARAPEKPARSAAIESAPTRAAPQTVNADGRTPERVAVDHLAAGDFAQALRDYAALAARSPAHSAAVRILERKVRAEREAP